MKNKTTKTIACLLAGLTLTACDKKEAPLEASYSFSAIEPRSAGSRTAVVTLEVEAEGKTRVHYGNRTFSQSIGSPTLSGAGVATYTGSASWYDWSDGKFVTGFEAITLSVNFSDRTIVSTHGGRFGINGAWNRNQGENSITGTATLSGHDDAFLEGVIGNDGILGRYHNSIDFAGGFTASRR